MTPKQEEKITNGGGGMSRAAKKRAKKKNKKPEGKRSAPNDHCDDDLNKTKKSVTLAEPNGNCISSNKKRKKTIEKESSSNHIKVKDTMDEDDSASAKTPPASDVKQGVELPPQISISQILLLKECKDESVRQQLESMITTQRAACLFQAILAPITLEEFYDEYFEKKPLVVTARPDNLNRARFSNLLSLESIKALSKKHSLYYGRDLNVTKYKKGTDGVKRRITLDKIDNDNHDQDDDEPSGVLVDNSELWSNYDKGCTIRLLCPHKYNDAVQSLLSTLEHEFHCMVGANAYLTPPRSSQGFAPHYDDIDAFCLQLEGSKRWKVYEPTVELPRTSSEDFTPEDLEGIEPVLDVTLEEGDLLYMPRGWIHQACTLKDNNQHSLHLTVSAMQQWAWIDLMEIVVPEALRAAAESSDSTNLREGLPQGFMDYMGVQYEETETENLPESLKKSAQDEKKVSKKLHIRSLLRQQFKEDAKKRIMEIAKTACDMLDASCDEVAKRYLSERQPPALTANEVALTAHGDETADERPLLPNTMCRLVRPGIARLVIEDDKAVVYHCADNSRDYQGNPISPLEFEMDDGPALEQLLTTVEPHWIFINDLFHDTIDDKIQITQALYDEGIIAVREASGAMVE
mmetsp:Transcript_24214/g.57140  ORF Transcript_24214/g.57140 Transcript_24214/m.57140 type:complete len:632 (-) Transcript_24214:1011-2906(-)